MLVSDFHPQIFHSHPPFILPKALVLQDKSFGKNYLSFLEFTCMVITSGRVEFLSPDLVFICLYMLFALFVLHVILDNKFS